MGHQDLPSACRPDLGKARKNFETVEEAGSYQGPALTPGINSCCLKSPSLFLKFSVLQFTNKNITEFLTAHGRGVHVILVFFKNLLLAFK